MHLTPFIFTKREWCSKAKQKFFPLCYCPSCYLLLQQQMDRNSNRVDRKSNREDRNGNRVDKCPLCYWPKRQCYKLIAWMGIPTSIYLDTLLGPLSDHVIYIYISNRTFPKNITLLIKKSHCKRIFIHNALKRQKRPLHD